MDVNWLNSASLIKKSPGREWKPKSIFYEDGGIGEERKQELEGGRIAGTANWTKGIERQMKKRRAHWRQIFIMACAIPNNKNSFISVTFSLLLNPTPHINWFLITPILDFLVIIHIGSLITASTEKEMKSRIEYLYTWCQIKLLCQVFQSRVVRKLNQNLMRNGSSDKFRISVPQAFRQRRIKRSCTWH